MTKWNLLLVWNVVLTVAVGWVIFSGMWGVGKQLDQISQITRSIDSSLGNINYNLQKINYSLEVINVNIAQADYTYTDYTYTLASIDSTLDYRLKQIDSTLDSILWRLEFPRW